jgi:hypothetical protein
MRPNTPGLSGGDVHVFPPSLEASKIPKRKFELLATLRFNQPWSASRKSIRPSPVSVVLSGANLGTFTRVIVHDDPAVSVDARSSMGSLEFSLSATSSIHPLEESRKKTDAICSFHLVFGVMSFQWDPLSVVQKRWLLVAAHPTSGVSSFMDLIGPACCASTKTQENMLNADSTMSALSTRIEVSSRSQG